MTNNVHNFVVNNFIYAGLKQLRLIARETNFSSSFKLKVANSRLYAYNLNS